MRKPKEEPSKVWVYEVYGIQDIFVFLHRTKRKDAARFIREIFDIRSLHPGYNLRPMYGVGHVFIPDHQTIKHLVVLDTFVLATDTTTEKEK